MVWLSGTVTALFFTVGKFLIGSLSRRPRRSWPLGEEGVDRVVFPVKVPPATSTLFRSQTPAHSNSTWTPRCGWAGSILLTEHGSLTGTYPRGKRM
jgi:hypothetical protein